MSEKIACTACGNLILVSTATDNGGQCTPCKRGIRKNIEDAKLRYAAAKKAVAAAPDPARDHWRWLVRQVYDSPDGFACLSAENRNYFAACLLEGEIYHGGFDQHFCSNSADYYQHAVRGLMSSTGGLAGRPPGSATLSRTMRKNIGCIRPDAAHIVIAHPPDCPARRRL